MYSGPNHKSAKGKRPFVLPAFGGRPDVALLRPCIDCGQPSPGTRCALHSREQNRIHHNRVYDDAAWKRYRARVLGAWRRAHGEWCPGDGGEHLPHPIVRPDFLTLDHIEGIGAGLFSPTRVLCSRWNSVLGGRAAHS